MKGSIVLKKSILKVVLMAAFVFAAADCVRAEWKPLDNKIMTRWSKEVSPEKVWPEYPRPQLMRGDWQSLNGLWDYSVLDKTAAQPKKFQGEILVPFCVESALSGVKKSVTENDRIWYRRNFDVPVSWKGKRVLLHFEAVDWETGVWFNGAYIGGHKGAYDRFSFDVTDYLNESGKQECVVSVWDPSSLGSQARGKQQKPQQGIWYTPVSGIWQTVWLEAVSKESSIKEVKITPDVDAGTVTILPMKYEPLQGKYQVELVVKDGGKVVAKGSGEADREITLEVPNAKLWSPDSPFLYDVKMKLVKGGKAIDEVSSYFGMRKISLGDSEKGKVMCLNNKPLFHYGTLDQGWWPDGLHTPPTDEAMKYDIEITKQMGFNMIRKHIKVEPARWYYWCDKLGIMVWQDMPSGMVVLPKEDNKRPAHVQHVGGKDPDIFRRTDTAAQFEWELRRMIDIHYNSPSIVIWVPFNEGWGQYDTCRVADTVKSYDPSRLVNGVSGWALRPCGDIYDIHTYGTQLKVPERQADMATVVGEFGGIGYPVKDHLWNPNMRNWGYQTSEDMDKLMADYVHKFNQIVEMKENGLSGAVYTQTTDVEGEVNGLMTYDRKVIKFKPEDMEKLHSVLYEE